MMIPSWLNLAMQDVKNVNIFLLFTNYTYHNGTANVSKQTKHVVTYKHFYY